jgi:hypothetical protein
MKTILDRYAPVALLLPVMACGLVAAGESLPEPNSLVFENSSEELRWATWGNEVPGKRPTYVAVMPLNESRCFESRLPRMGPAYFGNCLRDYHVSDEQREFLQPFLAGPVGRPPDPSSRVTIDEGPATPRQVLIYAVSLDDAQKTARAYLAYANAQYSSAAEEKKRYIQQNSETVQNGNRRLAELEETHKKNSAEFEELKTKITYRDMRQAGEVMSDLDRAILGCTIEITGIRTKLEWITNYLHGDKGLSLPESARPRLDSMFIEESIALKAAEARLKAATDLRTQTQRYADLTVALWQVPAEKEKLADQVRQAGESVGRAQKELADLIPPAVLGGKVFIHKVRPAQDQ